MQNEKRQPDKASAQYIKMTETPVAKLILMLGIPTTISMLVTSIYNMADTYFVGQIGTSASGAVGVVFGLMAIIQAFGFMFGHGAGSIVSRSLGARDSERATRIASTSFVSAGIAGLCISVLGILCLDPLMRLLGSTETILPYARTYAFYILLAAPFMASSCVLNNVLRYEGRAALAMVGLVSGGLLNIFGDWLLVNRLNMGVRGAGLATGVSQTISFCILLSMFLRGKTESKLQLKYATKMRMDDVLLICKTGFPSMMRQGLSSVSTMVLNGQAGVYGDAAVAAMSIVNRVCFFAFSVGLGIGQGFQPVSAFNYGAKKYDRVRKGFLATWGMGELFLGLFAVVGFFNAEFFVSLFRDDPEVIAIGTVALSAQMISLFFQPLCVCANMMFQSIGKNGVATFLSMLRSGLFLIPILVVLSSTLGLIGIEIAQPVSDVLTFVVSVPFVISFLKTLKRLEAEKNKGIGYDSMKKYELAIFDLDGTILDTLDDLTDSVNYALEKHGYPTRTKEEIRTFVGDGLLMLVRRAIAPEADENVIQTVLATQKAYYKDHCADKTKPYDGILELLAELKKADVKLAVVSNKADYAVQILCEQYFSGIFHMAVGEKETVRKKPAPDSVYTVLDELQVEKERAVYIGDSEVDIETAKNAGLDAVLVTWGFRDTEFLKEKGAKTLVNDRNALKNALIHETF